MNIYVTNQISKIYNKINELTKNDSIFKKETLIIVKNDLIKEEIKKTIADLNEISYNLNIKKNVLKIIYKISLKSHNMRQFLEKNSFLFYPETEKFILYEILKSGKIKNLSGFKSTKDRYMFSSQIMYLFHQYYSKFSKLIEIWRKNEFLFQDKSQDSYKHECIQKEIFEKLFNNQKNIFDLQQKIAQEKITIQENIEIKKIIFIGNDREIEKKFLHSLKKIFNLQVYELVLEDPFKYQTPLMKELLLLSRKTENHYFETQILKESEIVLFEGKNFLTSIKNNIISQTPLTKLDNSFKIIEAKNKRREVEILTNKILHSIQTNNIKLNEIAIACLPEEFNQYLPYIDELLNKYDINFKLLNYTDLAKGESILALKKLMNLFASKDKTIRNFNRKEILNLLSNNKIMKKFNISISELNYLIEFSDAININFGMNNDHKKKLKYDQCFLNSWEDGFQRFLMSEMFDETYEEDLQKESIKFQDKESIIKLITIIRSLYTDINYFKDKEYKVCEWAKIIELFIQKYINLEEFDITDEYLKNKLKSFKNFARDFNDNLFKDYFKNISETKIEFGLFSMMLEESLENENHKLMYEKNGILIANYKEIEYLQKKEIHLLGTQKLSSSIEQDNKNLLNEYYEYKNIEKEVIVTLFNLIFSTSERFYLYYSLENEINPEIDKPSIINTIFNYIQKYEKNFQIEKHPNENYDLKYFQEKKEEHLINYDFEAFNIAKTLQKKEYINFRQKKIPLQNLTKLSFYELKSALENPYKHFYEKILNVKIKDVSSENEIKEKREEQIFNLLKFTYNLIRDSMAFHEYIIKKTDKNEILRKIKKNLEYEIQQGNIPSNIEKEKTTNTILETLDKIKTDFAKNLTNFIKIQKANISFCENKNINFQKKLLKFEFKTKLKNIYQIGTDYFHLNFLQNDYNTKSDNIKNKIDLYLIGLLLKIGLKDFNSLTEIKINCKESTATLSNRYYNRDIVIDDIENIFTQFAYISSYPTPVYQNVIIETLSLDTINKDNFLNSFVNLINKKRKDPIQGYLTNKKVSKFEKNITFCNYYTRFNDTHDFKIEERLLTLLEKFYIKFIIEKN